MLDQETRDRITSHIEQAREGIAQSLAKSDDPSRSVLLMAVSKTVGIEEVQAAIDAGVHDFGENRAQELQKKSAAYPNENWHFIGRIQTNKLKEIVGTACMIHSVSSIHVLDAIQKQAAKKDVVQKVLIEVNVSGEESKDGFVEADVEDALEHATELPNVEVCGFMTMAPLGELDVARQVFRRLREIRDKYKVLFVNSDNVKLTELSMGMTQDYTEAVEEGATVVRLGRSIFA